MLPYILACGVLLCGCATSSVPKPVAVEFDNDAPGGFRRFVIVSERTVTTERPERFDLVLASDRPKGIHVAGSGSRDLAWVGRGSEEQFHALAERIGTWSIRDLEPTAREVGIVPGDQPADYWTPNDGFLSEGTILAVRDRASKIRDIGGLVYVRSIDGNRRVLLVIADAAPAGSG